MAIRIEHEKISGGGGSYEKSYGKTKLFFFFKSTFMTAIRGTYLLPTIYFPHSR